LLYRLERAAPAELRASYRAASATTRLVAVASVQMIAKSRRATCPTTNAHGNDGATAVLTLEAAGPLVTYGATTFSVAPVALAITSISEPAKAGPVNGARAPGLTP
jgi:hypothetical protein